MCIRDRAGSASMEGSEMPKVLCSVSRLSAVGWFAATPVSYTHLLDERQTHEVIQLFGTKPEEQTCGFCGENIDVYKRQPYRRTPEGAV